jgi:hypothetical protein
MGLHLTTSHLQVLMDGMMDAKQPIHKIRHEDGSRLLLVAEPRTTGPKAGIAPSERALQRASCL